jgi:Tfp pilus assembly protein PilO
MVPTARILADRRLLVSVLAVLAVANFIGLAMVVGPMRSRVQALTQRATTASLAVSTATRDLAAARQTSEGSVQAVTDLQRFYADILPADQPAARQVTLVRLARLARDSDLSYDRRSFEQDPPEDDGVLARETLSMSVFGSYRNLRQFLYALETGPDFIVVRQVSVAQGGDATEPLEAALVLSTYFKARDGR